MNALLTGVAARCTGFCQRSTGPVHPFNRMLRKRLGDGDGHGTGAVVVLVMVSITEVVMAMLIAIKVVLVVISVEIFVNIF